MKVAAIIVAAGSGIRAGGEKPKQYQFIGGKPVLRWTLEAFAAHPLVNDIVTVIGENHESEFAAAALGLKVMAPVQGGATRQDSCRLGLEACVPLKPDLVLIHDAARPFVAAEIISDVIAKLQESDAAIPALAVADTLKQAKSSIVEKTVDRAALFAVQTPQGFRFEKIMDAHRKAFNEGKAFLTDDAGVAEAYGLTVGIVPGEARNRKLTSAEDIRIANQELMQEAYSKRPDVRVGQGIDFHTFEKGKSIWLCGVEIPHTHKLKGHSDADVALHALTDAILATLGEGDIGTHFPPSDPQWKGAKSTVFLAKAVSLLKAQDAVLAHVDLNILAEAPKVSPHVSAMKESLSGALGLATNRIAIKATTTEEMGALGRKEGMAAFATVTVRFPI